jgi:hypothetical protein
MLKEPAFTSESRIPWRSEVLITVRDMRDNIIERVVLKNLITNVGKNLLRDALESAAFDAEIKRVALGTSATAPAVGDTQLGAEGFRKVVTQQTKPGTGQVKTTAYIAPQEAIFNIQEIGWFAGASAGAGVNSGVMIARVLYARNKTNLESIQIDRTETIG